MLHHMHCTQLCEDVPRSEEELLVAWDETRCSGICIDIFDLLASQGRTPETWRITSADRDPKIEVGRYCFQHETTSDSQWL